MSKNNITLVVNFFVPKKKIPFSIFCTISLISDLRTNMRHKNTVFLDIQTSINVEASD